MHSINTFLRSITWPLLSQDSKVLHVFCRGHVEDPCTGQVANLDKLKVISAAAEIVAPMAAVL
jgi:hypothetical protein